MKQVMIPLCYPQIRRRGLRIVHSLLSLIWTHSSQLLIPYPVLLHQTISQIHVVPANAPMWLQVFSLQQIFSRSTTATSLFVTPAHDSFPWRSSGRTPLWKSDNLSIICFTVMVSYLKLLPIWKSLWWLFWIITRSSESDGRSDVTDSLDCPDRFRLPW